MKWKRTKKTFLIVFLIVSVLLSLSFLIIQNDFTVEATVSVVDSNIVGDYATIAVRLQKQHKLFYAVGRYWVWYSNGANAGFKTSTDGSLWSSFTSIGTCTVAAYFDVSYNGTKICYVRGHYLSYYLKYRSGLPNSDGSITWDTTAEQTVLSGVSYDVGDPTVRIDSFGYPYISYVYNYAFAKSYISKSNFNNGTWQTASGYPILIDRYEYMGIILALPNGKMYFVYAVGFTYATPHVMYGRLYDGASWGSEVQITTSNVATDDYQEYDAIADSNGNVHVQFIKASTHELKYCLWSYSTQTWGAEESVYSNLGDSRAACLSETNGVIYSFWQGYPTASHIYYTKRVSGVWSSSVIDWIVDSDGMPNKRNLECSYISYSNETLVIWLSKTSSPYSVKFSFLTTATNDTSPPTYSNLGVNNTLAGELCKFSVKWSDNVGLSSYRFGTNNTGSWVNDTWTVLSGNPAWSNVTKMLNSTVGVKIAYRFWCNDTSDNLTDTGLTFLTTSSGSVTIEIYESWISDQHLNYGSEVTIKFRHRYSNNQTACETGTSYVNGTLCAINATGWITYTKTYSAVVKYSFTVTQVNVKGYTTFQMVTSDAEVVWDRIRIDSLGKTDADGRVNVNSEGTFYATASLEYDNHVLGSSDSLTLGGHVFLWTVPTSRFEYSSTQTSVLAITINSFTSGSEATYGITVGNINSKTATLIWEKLIVTFSASKTNPNTGETIIISWTITRQYDSSTVTDFLIDIARDSLLWKNDLTSSNTIDISIVDTVKIYTLYPSTVTDNIYGITMAQFNSVTVTWITLSPPPPPPPPPSSAFGGVQTTTPFQIIFLTNSALCFQDSIDKTLDFYVQSGTLNSSNAVLTAQNVIGTYYLGGSLRFTNLQTTTLNITHNFNGLIITVDGTELTSFISGDLVYLSPYDTVQISWIPQYQIPDLISSAYDYAITQVMIGFITIFVPSTIFGLSLTKYKLGIVGFMIGLNIMTGILFNVGFVSLVFLFTVVIVDVLIVLALLYKKGVVLT